jgi:hypothetical protein
MCIACALRSINAIVIGDGEVRHTARRRRTRECNWVA